MDITINGNRIDFTIENETSLGEVLGELESACENAGMTVTSVSVDGKPIPAEELDGYFARPLEGVSSIDLRTLDAAGIMAMLREYGARLSDFVPRLRDIPLQLQTGKDLPVMETIHGFSIDLRSLYQLLPLLPITGIAEDRSTVDGVPLSAYPSELAPVLAELIKALEVRDTVLAGDLSEYELAPRIERLGAVLSAI